LTVEGFVEISDAGKGLVHLLVSLGPRAVSQLKLSAFDIAKLGATMMCMIFDDTPPPPSLNRALRNLEPGKSVLADTYTLKSVQVMVSRFRADHPEREFTVRMTKDGPRVWRLA
jgi:hypothetical protein